MGWKTIRGVKVYIEDGESRASVINKIMMKRLKATKSIAEKNRALGKSVREAIKELNSDKYPDGTYDVNTKKEVNFNDGYQATFQQMGDKYSDEEYGALIQKYMDKTDGRCYAGKFGGSPEVSFHFSSRKEAMKICREYNQVSYWDWKTCSEVKNPYYKEGKGNDYE